MGLRTMLVSHHHHHHHQTFSLHYSILPSICLTAQRASFSSCCGIDCGDGGGGVAVDNVGQKPRYSGKKMLSSHGQEGEILRDVTRTFPLEPLFRNPRGVGQNLLANILKALLAFHHDVGWVYQIYWCF